MLELNAWFFVLLLNFLLLIFILNHILFKPLLRLFRDRDDTVRGSLQAAKAMDARKEETMARMNRELQEARNRSKEIFERLRKDGMFRQKEILEAASAHAHNLLEKAKEELKSETERARQSLRPRIEKFSEEIVRKLVGV